MKVLTRNILSKCLTTSPKTTCPKYQDDIENGFIEYGSDHLPIIVDIV